MQVLGVSRIVHDGHLNGYTLLLSAQVDDIIEEVYAAAIHITDKVTQSAFAVILLGAGLALLIGTQVSECDGDACVQVSKLAHAIGKHLKVIGGNGEDAGIGPELLSCAAQSGLAHYLHGIESLALLVFLLVDLAVAEHLREHVGREGIHTTHTHTVQTTAHLVAALVKLTACVKHGHHDLKGAHALFLVDIHGNTTPLSCTVMLLSSLIVTSMWVQ